MTNAKLIAKLRMLLEDAQNTDKKRIKKLRKVLGKLKKQQYALRDSLAEIKSPHERSRIEQEIEVITVQRSKGVEIYKQLKNARDIAKQEKSKNSPGSAKNPGGTGL